MTDGPKPLTVEALRKALAARGVKVARRTVDRWKEAGCPHHKASGLRGRLTFDLEEVVAWLDDLGRTGERGRPPVEKAEPGRQPQPGATASAPGRLNPDELTGEQLTLMTRQANLRIKELEAAKRERLEQAARGELVPVDDLRRYWAERVSALQSALRVLPDRVGRAAGDAYEPVFAEAEVAIEDALAPFGRGLPW